MMWVPAVGGAYKTQLANSRPYSPVSQIMSMEPQGFAPVVGVIDFLCLKPRRDTLIVREYQLRDTTEMFVTC